MAFISVRTAELLQQQQDYVDGRQWNGACLGIAYRAFDFQWYCAVAIVVDYPGYPDTDDCSSRR